MEVLIHQVCGYLGPGACIFNGLPDATDAADPCSTFSMMSFLIIRSLEVWVSNLISLSYLHDKSKKTNHLVSIYIYWIVNS